MSASTRRLIIEAKDLDTDERAVAVLEVLAPASAEAQRGQIMAEVGRLFPTARFRSFGDGAASFLTSQELVVAHYEKSETEPAAEQTAIRDAPLAEQRSLFAA
jgi:hypothetical protein